MLLLTIMVISMIVRLFDVLNYSPDVGPLIKIVGKMSGDVLNFLVLYLILTLTFAMIGTYNFRGLLDEFSSIL